MSFFRDKFFQSCPHGLQRGDTLRHIRMTLSTLGRLGKVCLQLWGRPEILSCISFLLQQLFQFLRVSSKVHSVLVQYVPRHIFSLHASVYRTLPHPLHSLAHVYLIVLQPPSLPLKTPLSILILNEWILVCTGLALFLPCLPSLEKRIHDCGDTATPIQILILCVIDDVFIKFQSVRAACTILVISTYSLSTIRRASALVFCCDLATENAGALSTSSSCT
mmetsp:Transcript_74991/g.118202  ORF Transcript_74991/g.118202 Transcript_74991/m.118202 type:complete len:220 (+) Transcript_74991:186-845(+)